MSSSSLELDSILRLPVSRSISEIIEKFLHEVQVEKVCYFFSKQSRFSEVEKVSFCGSHLIFQLLRFSEVNGTFVKNSDHVLYDNVILFLITNPDGSVLQKKFILKALVNHVGTLANGHYTTIVLHHHCERLHITYYVFFIFSFHVWEC